MQPTLLILAVALMYPPGDPPAAGRGGRDLILPDCSLSLPDESDVEVPAPEAGRLEALEARVGYHVEAEGLIATVDDNLVKLQRQVAEHEASAARKEADSDVNVRYAKASVDVAREAYNIMKIGNRAAQGAIPKAQLLQKAFEMRRAELSVEQAAQEHDVAEMTALAKEAALGLADEQLARRQIRAPISGEIKEVMKVKGEWVQAGEPVLRIVRLDQLTVRARIHHNEYLPGEVQNRPVTFEAELKPGRVEKVQGKVIFVDPEVSVGGEYVVWAEIPNRKDAGSWVLFPGVTGQMTVHVNALANVPGEAPNVAREARRP